MKHWRITCGVIIVVLALFPGLPALTQTISNGSGQEQFDLSLSGDFELLSLPKVLDSARFRSPTLKNAELDLRSQELALKDAKLVILKAMSFNGSYAYGTNARFSSAESTSSDLNNSLSVTESANYSLGLGIRLSLYDILNRKNLLSRSNIEIEKFRHNIEVVKMALDELVVSAYHDCLLKKKLVDLYASDKESAGLNLQMANQQFRLGEITIAQVTDVVDSHSKSIINFESAKVKLQMSLFKLSQLSGISVNDLIIDEN